MRTLEVQQAIDGVGKVGYGQVLAAEVERLEKRENELINALDMGQINCDAVYDELREERDDAKQRAEAAEARAAELEAQNARLRAALHDALSVMPEGRMREAVKAKLNGEEAST